MKKIRELVCFILCFSILMCMGCPLYSVPKEYIENLKLKDSMKPFDHLLENLDEAPLVIAMPCYVTRHLWGNKNYKEKGDERVGDMIVAIDTKTNTMYDWVFFPGDHRFSEARIPEIGTPRKYYHASRNVDEMACLDPSTGKLDIIKTPTYYGNHVFLTDKQKGLLVDSPRQLDMCLHIFDTSQTPLKMHKPIELLDANFITLFNRRIYADPDGNFWFAYEERGNYVNHLVKVDTETGTVHEYLTNPTEEGNNRYSYLVKYVDNDYVLIDHNKLGTDIDYEHEVCIVDKKNLQEDASENKIDKKATISFESEGKVLKIQNITKVAGEYYVQFVSLSENNKDEIYFYKIVDIDTDAPRLEYVTNFDFGIYVYDLWVRGTKIYVMNSRSFSDVSFCYYDVATNTLSDTFRLNIIQIGEAWDAELAASKK